MKKVAVLLLYLTVLLIPDNVYAAEYSLHDLYRLALEKSEVIQIAEEDLFISEKQKDKARAVLFPTLSAFGAHRRYSEEKVNGFDILQPDHTS
ncbi:MAG: TolC family protein, partial [Deltaproteobacteria bacterium]|nr:TolC family protein [Deltaproteobacteria bacterium]